jgi:hypothetical protein
MAIVYYSFSDAMRPVPPQPENQPLTHEDAQMNSFEILSTFVKQRTYPPPSPDRSSASEKLGKDETQPSSLRRRPAQDLVSLLRFLRTFLQRF